MIKCHTKPRPLTGESRTGIIEREGARAVPAR